MPPWLRWIAYGVGALASLIVVAVALLYVVSSRHINRVYHFDDSPVRAANDPASLARGRHLVEAVVKCQECHGDDYGGKPLSDSPMFGRLTATNLTSGRGGTKDFTDADWERALRHGVAPGGRQLIFMPSEAFTMLTDADLSALVGYLRTIPAVDHEWPAPEVGPIARALYLKGGFPLLPAALIDHKASRRDLPEGVSIEYGEYLATIGGCRSCHGAGLDGTGAPDVPDITRGRLANWKEEDFFRALRAGQRPDGTPIDPTKMPWPRSGHMTDDEIRAVWMYNRSLPGPTR
ncbi:MAG: c-type cytochrome [Gemmatimonadales bacterium]